MEYNLQKTIEQNIFHSIPNSTYPILTQYPATDFVNPGLGQVSRLYSFYVPLFAQKSSSYEIKKSSTDEEKDPIEIEQTGMGEEDISETEDNILNQLNERKRKKMDDGVYDSFTHPKVFVTKKILLKPENLISSIYISEKNRAWKLS
jgi:hypothetical protein